MPFINSSSNSLVLLCKNFVFYLPKGFLNMHLVRLWKLARMTQLDFHLSGMKLYGICEKKIISQTWKWSCFSCLKMLEICPWFSGLFSCLQARYFLPEILQLKVEILKMSCGKEFLEMTI
uniref:Uncharacterized protein n=1 Tax=Opuntia streptacantha TaxID=393608 RepID=A0A7C9AMR2_OPUST